MSDLDRQAAEIMGWRKWDGAIEEGDLYGSEIDSIRVSSGMGLKCDVDWSPSTRWDHAGILIEWSWKKKMRLYIAEYETYQEDDSGPLAMLIAFANHIEGAKSGIHTSLDDPLTPKVITEAFVAAFGGGE